MALLGMKDVTIAFGSAPLLEDASFSIEPGERVCLLGRNGAGKSTLMKLLDGTLVPDDGEIVRQTGVTVARLEQEVPEGVGGTVYDVVAEGLGEVGALVARYHAASHRVSVEHGGDAAMREMDRLHHALDAANAWSVQTRVETVLEHLALDPDAPFAAASGGRKRQALLARALVREPDVLLLDEPTNHLDVDAIEWMEQFLIDRGITLLFVTHDRAFLRRVATRIVELDRGRLVDWGADYDQYVERKAASLEQEARDREAFEKKMDREQVRLRSSITARRTLNEGRARRLDAMRRERAAWRTSAGTVKLQAVEAERSGRLVIEAKDVSVSLGGRAILRDVSATIMRGDKVGIIGPNGSGKTTLIRTLLGELAPDAGSVRLGTGLEVLYFDQLRAQLEPETSVFDSIADGADWITIAGERKHVLSYLQDFLFPPERARTPVRALSGGERNRLLLARLFTRTFNVLVLDEPTNDLDIETLDLLEELLLEFSGTLLLVSHDRAFLDAVVTSTLVLEGNGRVGEYAGGYTDWLRQRKPLGTAPSPKPSAASPPPSREKPKARKLTLAEAKELASLPERIDALERERATAFESLGDPALARDPAALADAKARLTSLDEQLETAMARWEALEAVAAG